MGFQSAKEFNEERYNGWFTLRSDGDFADVIFLYPSYDDVLIADKVHYIKSDSYSGYVHCCGKGCPACAKGLQIRSRLFVPVYNINTQEIEFFDRSSKFDLQLQQDVFSRFANPSNYVFRITRHGSSGDINTQYEITLCGELNGTSYDAILSDKHVTFPEYYNTVCKEVTVMELNNMLANNSNAPSVNVGSYNVTPRVSTPQYDGASVTSNPVNTYPAVISNDTDDEPPFTDDIDDDVQF